MKKDKKKKKQKEVEVVLGKKVRDVKVSEKQHFLLFVSMLVLFNLLMVASIWFVLIYMNKWYNWVICIALLFVTFGLSFKTYCDTKLFNKCTIYDNAIEIKSIWFNFKFELKDVYEMNVKESFLDKAFKTNTKSLVVKVMNHRRHKFTIHFIEENAVKLKQEITMMIDKLESNKDEEKTSK